MSFDFIPFSFSVKVNNCDCLLENHFTFSVIIFPVYCMKFLSMNFSVHSHARTHANRAKSMSGRRKETKQQVPKSNFNGHLHLKWQFPRETIIMARLNSTIQESMNNECLLFGGIIRAFLFRYCFDMVDLPLLIHPTHHIMFGE